MTRKEMRKIIESMRSMEKDGTVGRQKKHAQKVTSVSKAPVQRIRRVAK